MTLYSVSEVSKLTGVTIKTLHYYQKIDLLTPAYIGENKYRYYSEDEINVLQEIMFYRTMDIPLSRVKELLVQNVSKDRIQILEEQLAIAHDKKNKMDQVIQTLEKTINAERKHEIMEHKEKFEGLKKDDSIYRTMQNLTIIFSKPVSVVFLVLSAAIVWVHGLNLLEGFSIYGENPAALVISFMIVILGIIGFVVSFRNVFLVKTKDVLEIINQPYKKK